MAVSAVKTFISGEVLTASDLNALNTNILNNGEDLGWPATKAKDFNGQSATLDADGDTSMTSDTDDRIDFACGGVDVFRIDGTTASSVNGIDVVSAATGSAPSVLAMGTDTNVGLELSTQAAGVLTYNGVEVFEATYAAKTSDQSITSGTEADITSMTALTLPSTTSVNTKTFEVHFSLNLLNSDASANFTTITFYSGSTGDKGDTEVFIRSVQLNADATFGAASCSGFFRYSPATSSDTKFGLSAKGGATFVVKGSSNAISTIKVIEVG